jgi:hypothetical protein
MLSKAQAAGLTFAPAAVTAYPVPLEGKYALDQLHESWNVAWGIPASRTIAANSSLANSVALRCKQIGYQPGNLKLQNGVPVPGYGTVAVVA